jgi:hypothetical protein
LIFAISISKVRRIHFLLNENETSGNKIDEQQKYITRLEQKLLQFTGRGDYPKKSLTSKEKNTDFVSNLESSENKQKHNKGRPKIDQRYFRKTQDNSIRKRTIKTLLLHMCCSLRHSYSNSLDEIRFDSTEVVNISVD